MKLRPYGVLVYQFVPFAIRFIVNEGGVTSYYDVAVSSYDEDDVRGFIKGLKKISLIDNGDMYITKEELKKGIIVEDKSDDLEFIKETLRVLKFLNREDNDLKVTNKFLVEVRVIMVHPKKGNVIRTYKNVIFGQNESEAREEAIRQLKEDLNIHESAIVGIEIKSREKLSIK